MSIRFGVSPIAWINDDLPALGGDTPGGVDTLALVRTHPHRIAHVHCKGIRSTIFERAQSEGRSFLSGVLSGMFTVPGDGDIEFASVMQALAQVGYSGWIIVEAEQDPAVANPKRYAALGLQTLRREASAAGLLSRSIHE